MGFQILYIKPHLQAVDHAFWRVPGAVPFLNLHTHVSSSIIVLLIGPLYLLSHLNKKFTLTILNESPNWGKEKTNKQTNKHLLHHLKDLFFRRHGHCSFYAVDSGWWILHSDGEKKGPIHRTNIDMRLYDSFCFPSVRFCCTQGSLFVVVILENDRITSRVCKLWVYNMSEVTKNFLKGNAWWSERAYQSIDPLRWAGP